jgi:hypothetical protein
MTVTPTPRHDARANGAAGGLLRAAEHGQEDEDALPGAAARTGVSMQIAHTGPWSAVTAPGLSPLPRAQYFFDFQQELRLDARNIRLRGPQVRAVQNGCPAVPTGSTPSSAALTCADRSRRTTGRPLRARATRRPTSTRRVVGYCPLYSSIRTPFGPFFDNPF